MKLLLNEAQVNKKVDIFFVKNGFIVTGISLVDRIALEKSFLDFVLWIFESIFICSFKTDVTNTNVVQSLLSFNLN